MTVSPLFQRYDLQRIAGRGGMGEVWQALDRERARRVAIKFLRARGEADLVRFEREIRILRSIEDARVVRCLDHGVDGERGAYLVNTARGPIVDEQALIEVLQAGKIAGAGLDVMEVEPLPADSPLNTLDNVILAPHLASFSDEGVHLHNLRVAKIIIDVVNGKMPERKIVINKALYDQLVSQPELANVEKA